MATSAGLAVLLGPLEPQGVSTAMPTMTLYSGPLSMYGAKVQIAALEKALPVEVIMVPFTDHAGYEQNIRKCCASIPSVRCRCWCMARSRSSTSTQIFEYFEHLQPQPALWPAAPAARARARLLELKSDEVFFPHVIRLMSSAAAPAGTGGTGGDRTATSALSGPGGLAGGERRLPGRRLQLCRHRVLHGAAVRRAARGADGPPYAARLLAWRSRVARRPAAIPVIVQFVHTLTGLGARVPAVHERRGKEHP